MPGCASEPNIRPTRRNASTYSRERMVDIQRAMLVSPRFRTIGASLAASARASRGRDRRGSAARSGREPSRAAQRRRHPHRERRGRRGRRGGYDDPGRSRHWRGDRRHSLPSLESRRFGPGSAREHARRPAWPRAVTRRERIRRHRVRPGSDRQRAGGAHDAVAGHAERRPPAEHQRAGKRAPVNVQGRRGGRSRAHQSPSVPRVRRSHPRMDTGRRRGARPARARASGRHGCATGGGYSETRSSIRSPASPTRRRSKACSPRELERAKRYKRPLRCSCSK